MWSLFGRKKQILGIILLLLQVVWSGVSFASSSKGINGKVSQLLIKAMKARDAGQLEQARLYWLQARNFKPTLVRPPWLDKAPVNAPPVMSKTDFLENLEVLPYAEAKKLLRSRLEKNPTDVALRERMLQLAQKAQDEKEVSRQKVLLGEKIVNTNFTVFKFILLLIVMALLIWQIFSFWQEWRSSKE